MYHFDCKRAMKKHIWRHILLLLDAKGPPPSPSPSVSQLLLFGLFTANWNKKKRKRRKCSLMKCLTVYIPSQFISLSIESIADVWERDCWGQSQLLQKWGTLFRKEYEILIKPLHLQIIPLPPSRQGGSHCFFRHSGLALPHCAETAPIFWLNDIRLGFLYLLSPDRENQLSLKHGLSSISGPSNWSGVT